MVVTAGLAIGAGGCASGSASAGHTPNPPPGEAAARQTGLPEGVLVEHAAQPVRWAMLLPGASGLKIFDDDAHYTRAARRLAARGFDVLIVDYKRVYRALRDPGRPTGETGDKIAWVARSVLGQARQSGIVRPGEPGAIIAWSLGGEGLWSLLSETPPARDMGVRACAAWYPANEKKRAIAPGVPLLIFAGGKDDATPLTEWRAALGTGPAGAAEVVEYPEALHGFDVESVVPPRTVRLLPLIGPSATFGYNQAAATDAWSRLETFLDAHVR